MPSVKDPRHYIRSKPLPITSQKGIKIQARSDHNYNPTIPSRKDVREHNYSRRQEQMSSMGFNCVPYKKYRGIGDPFYLDQKKMILHALGQWSEEMESSSSSSDEDDDDAYYTRPQQSMTPTKFALRRSRKDMNNINKSLAHDRNVMRNVRLGHSFFQIVNKEAMAKKQEKDDEEKRQKEKLRTECQPAKMDTSSDDETDEELSTEVDLRQFMISSATKREEKDTSTLEIPEDDIENRSRVAFQGMDISGSALGHDLPHSAKSRKSTPGGKKKQPQLRPYTPQHTNLASSLTDIISTPDQHDSDKYKLAIFRQLCSLYWLLEYMSVVDSTETMSSVSTSWNFKNIGGTKIREEEHHKIKVQDTEWKRLISHRTHAKVPAWKRLAAPRPSKTPRRQSSANQRMSISSSISEVPSRIKELAAVTRVDSVIREEDENSVIQEGTITTTEDEEEFIHSKSLFTFLDSYYESLRKEREAEEAKFEASATSGAGDAGTQHEEEHQKHHSHHRGQHRPSTAPATHRKSLLMSTAEKQETDYRKSVDFGKARSHSVGAKTELLRPKSSQALMDFQSRLPSNKLKDMPAQMREKFSEVRDEQAHMMHEALEGMERQRLKTIHSKFRHMPTGGAFHRAIRTMRVRSRMEEEDPNKKQASTHLEWFTYLLDILPPETQKDWFVNRVLQKIAKYGSKIPPGQISIEQVESPKQSARRFLKVLKQMRNWEICNPDVSAAIEFCREKIIEIPVEEYEDWFTQEFPMIVRPQTAPASLGRNREKDKQLYTVPASAPPRTR